MVPEAGGVLGAALSARLGLLAAAMRARGSRLGIGELLSAHRALHAVEAADREQAYLALRATLCSRRDDLMLFDAAFEAVFGTARRAPADAERLAATSVSAAHRGHAAARAGDPAGLSRPDVRPAAWSDVELLRARDFAELTEAERALVLVLLPRLARVGPRRLSRRTRPARRRSCPQGAVRPDLRRTVRASLRYAGEPLERHWREPSERPRRLVLVCDVSGSMEPYARTLLAFVQAWVAARRRVEAFVFGTRLTRVSAELGGRDPELALERALRSAVDLHGGTRIGGALAALNREHGRRLGRGATVVIMSDGWDRGELELLDRELARLRRCSHMLVWLNPLKGRPGYEPLARGMRTALPHVDVFMAGSTLASLERLADLIQDRPMRGGGERTRNKQGDER